jgi:bacterial/archaeal transporter family-2 protein
VDTLVLGAAVLLAREGVPALSDVAGAPWWVWPRGLLGVFYLVASIILTPRLGAANTVAFVLAGQVLASMTLDQFGLLNLPVHSISLARLGAAALVIAGVFVVLRT